MSLSRIAAMAFALSLCVAPAYSAVPDREARFGQIIVVGNERTRQDVILDQISFFPGQVVTEDALRQSEANLRQLGIFETDENAPTVRFLDNPTNPDSEYKDVLVTVQETKTGSLTFGVGVNSDSGLTGSIVLQERNFDAMRWPTSLDDLKSLNAFRGAGKKLRVELKLDARGPRVEFDCDDAELRAKVNTTVERVAAWWTGQKAETKPTEQGSLMFGVGVNSDSGLTGSITEESASEAKPTAVVSEIVVQGNRLVSTESLLNMIKTRAGKNFVAETLMDDVRTLYKSGLFGNVYGDKQDDGPGRVKVFVYVRDHLQPVQKVTYQGNRQLSAADLESVTNVRVGSPLNPVANKVACERIVRRYNEEGRAFAACDLLKGADKSDTEVIFVINEGPRSRVRGVSFTGNKFFRSDELTERIRVLNVAPGSKYDATMTDKDIDVLTKLYGYYGYQDVKVTRELKFSTDGREVDVTFHVVEGVPARTSQTSVGCPDVGVRPTIAVLPNPTDPDSEFKDILVTVQEASTAGLMFGVGVNSDSGLTGSIVPKTAPRAFSDTVRQAVRAANAWKAW